MSSCQDSRAKGKRSGAEHFGKLIGKVIESLSSKEHLGAEEIRDAWRKAAGDAAARHAQPVSLKKATLVVNVANSSWLYELSVRKKELLQSLESGLRGKKIRDIRFRIGAIASAQRQSDGKQTDRTQL